MARIRRFEDQLDNLAGVEIAANEFGIRLVLLERHDGEVGVRHYGVTYGGDAFQKVEGVGGGGAGEGLDEYYARGRLGTRGVEASDADWHCDKLVEGFVKDKLWVTIGCG